MSKKLSKEQVDAVFAKFDKDSDGKLSKEEFRQLMVSVEHRCYCLLTGFQSSAPPPVSVEKQGTD